MKISELILLLQGCGQDKDVVMKLPVSPAEEAVGAFATCYINSVKEDPFFVEVSNSVEDLWFK